MDKGSMLRLGHKVHLQLNHISKAWRLSPLIVFLGVTIVTVRHSVFGIPVCGSPVNLATVFKSS